MVLRPPKHRDTFARESLRPNDHWPVFEFSLPQLQIPDPSNSAACLLDDALDELSAHNAAILQGDSVWSYAEVASRTDRLCHVLSEDLGVVPGDRILLRGANSPTVFALGLAVMKVGAIAVSTMPMLRSRELK